MQNVSPTLILGPRYQHDILRRHDNYDLGSYFMNVIIVQVQKCQYDVMLLRKYSDRENGRIQGNLRPNYVTAR